MVLAVMMLGLTAPAIVLLPGCAWFSPVEPGSESLVVNAERVAILSFTMVDTFLEWEHNNRAALPPNVTEAADALRDNFPPAYIAFRTATKTYKLTRSVADREEMNTTMMGVQKRTEMAAGMLPPVEKARVGVKAAALTVPPEMKSGSIPK